MTTFSFFLRQQVSSALARPYPPLFTHVNYRGQRGLFRLFGLNEATLHPMWTKDAEIREEARGSFSKRPRVHEAGRLEPGLVSSLLALLIFLSGESEPSEAERAKPVEV